MREQEGEETLAVFCHGRIGFCRGGPTRHAQIRARAPRFEIFGMARSWNLLRCKAFQRSKNISSLYTSFQLQTMKNNQFDESVDYVVIGSGIGGLTVASLLSQIQRDEKTLLLEQHSTIGGNLNSFECNGYPFSIGLHWVGDMNLGSSIRNTIDVLQPHRERLLSGAPFLRTTRGSTWDEKN